MMALYVVGATRSTRSKDEHCGYRQHCLAWQVQRTSEEHCGHDYSLEFQDVVIFLLICCLRPHTALASCRSGRRKWVRVSWPRDPLLIHPTDGIVLQQTETKNLPFLHSVPTPRQGIAGSAIKPWGRESLSVYGCVFPLPQRLRTKSRDSHLGVPQLRLLPVRSFRT